MIMESSDANDDDIPNTVLRVSKVGMTNNLSNNLIPIHPEYE